MREFEFEESQPDLFEVSGTINEEQTRKLEEALEVYEGYGTIKSSFREESKFIIGEPISRKLEPEAQEITPDIKAQLDNYDFYLVQLACSFLPADGCRFHTANFEIDLQSEPASPASIAYDQQPDKVEDELKVNNKFTLDPNLKIKVLQMDIGLSGVPFKAELSREYVAYTSRVTATGLQTSQPGWKFSRSKSHDINGSYRLLLIVRKPKGTKVTGRMSLSASQEYLLPGGPIGPLPLSTIWRKHGQLVDDQLIELV
ncbi:MAG TPA: hypothetical protein VH186_02210 [Chloroflexia bacterium]|nr:hypothetical protein [Chloroflexia bacterium]